MKRLFKKLFIPILASTPVSSLTRRLFKCGIPIFMLHRIAQDGQPEPGKTDPAHLRECLEYLQARNYVFMSLEHLITALENREEIPAKSVVFTVDDGYMDQAEIAAPIFIQYGCPMTFFVITGMLDQTVFPWDAQVSWIIETSERPSLNECGTVKALDIRLQNGATRRDLRRAIQNAMKTMDADTLPDIIKQLAEDAGVTVPDSASQDYLPMTWDIARRLENQGIRFAPHSVSHNILSRLSLDRMQTEVDQAWQLMRRELSNPLKVFCYPNGRQADFGEREIRFLQDKGFKGAVATTPDIVKPGRHGADYIYKLPRLALPDNMPDFIQQCSWIQQIRARHS